MRYTSGRSSVETAALIALVGLAAIPALVLLAQNQTDAFAAITNTAAKAPVFNLLKGGGQRPTLEQPVLPSALPNTPLATSSNFPPGTPDPQSTWQEPLPSMGSITTSAMGQTQLSQLPLVSSWGPLPQEYFKPGTPGSLYKKQVDELTLLANKITALEQQVSSQTTPCNGCLSDLNALVKQFVGAYDALAGNLPQDSPLRQTLNERAALVYQTAMTRYLIPGSQGPLLATSP